MSAVTHHWANLFLHINLIENYVEAQPEANHACKQMSHS
jgi:hypothetical protein